MKTLSLTFLVFIITISVFAQELPVLSTTSLANPDQTKHMFFTEGNYAQDTANERDQYVGTWEYKKKDILFQVKIEKRDKFLTKKEDHKGNILFYSYCDLVVFKYKLVKKGITIYDNLDKELYLEGDIYPMGTKKGSDEDLRGAFLDATIKAGTTVNVKYLDTAPEKIIFYLNPVHQFQWNMEESYNPDIPFTIPTGELEMIKIN